MSGSGNNRFIPSWKTIEMASKSLPKPEDFREETFPAAVGERIITFRKIKFKTKLGARTKWVYEGKVMID